MGLPPPQVATASGKLATALHVRRVGAEPFHKPAMAPAASLPQGTGLLSDHDPAVGSMRYSHLHSRVVALDNRDGSIPSE
jgi:hypothetical protein